MKNYPLYPVECFDDFNTALCDCAKSMATPPR